jgi:cobalt-zinc-cadmium efflux system outer membrane protein
MLTPLVFVLGVQGPSDSLTLEAAIALAQQRRGQAVVAAAAAAAARGEWRAAVQIPNPIASYSYTGDPPHQHATVAQPLDWLLTRGSRNAAGRAGIALAVADSVRILAEIGREVRHAFYGTLAATRRLAVAEEESVFADSLAGIAGRRLAAGAITSLEEAQAALEAARARQLVSTSREAYLLTLAALSSAVGVPGDSLAPLAGALGDGVAAGLPPAPALEDLPVVASARADSAAARAGFQVARLARIPFPALEAGAEWDNPDAGATLVFGVSLPFPVWNRGGAQAAAAGARAEEASARLLETRAAATRVLQQTEARVREAGRRALISQDSILPLAERQRDLALLAYQAGETGIVPVLDALRAERQVVRDLVGDLLAFEQARADWLALLGGTP